MGVGGGGRVCPLPGCGPSALGHPPTRTSAKAATPERATARYTRIHDDGAERRGDAEGQTYFGSLGIQIFSLGCEIFHTQIYRCFVRPGAFYI